jgi:hypothetical protein
MENLEEKYSHIKGWGIDADPENEPTYPIKKWTGDDHKRLNYERPPLQPETVEVLHSNERPTLSAAYGTTLPPSGLSGAIRRFAFRYSEGKWAHWLSLIFADRVDVMEGYVDDFRKGHVPNVFSEQGWKAMWQHNPKLVVKKVVIGVAVTAAVAALLFGKTKSKKAKFG